MFNLLSKGFSYIKSTFTPNNKNTNSVEHNTYNSTITSLLDIDEEFEKIMPTENKLKSIKTEESKKILKQAPIDAQSINFAYNINGNPAKAIKAEKINKDLSEQGIKLHTTTAQILGDNNAGRLQGAIFTDEANKTINVTFAGTRLGLSKDMLVDLWDDAKLALNLYTTKAKSIDLVNKYILTNFEEEIANGWKIHYTGHSLGGHSANFGATLMANSGKINTDDISVTTFESAGGDSAFRSATKYLGYSRSNQELCSTFTGNNVSFDSRKNVINTVDTKEEVTVYTVEQEHHGAYEDSMTSLKFWAIKLNPVQLFREHSMNNFYKLFDAVQPTGFISDNDGNVVNADTSDYCVYPDSIVVNADTSDYCVYPEGECGNTFVDC